MGYSKLAGIEQGANKLNFEQWDNGVSGYCKIGNIVLLFGRKYCNSGEIWIPFNHPISQLYSVIITPRDTLTRSKVFSVTNNTTQGFNIYTNIDLYFDWFAIGKAS